VPDSKRPAASPQPADEGLGGVARQLGSGGSDPKAGGDPSPVGGPGPKITLPGVPSTTGGGQATGTEVIVPPDTAKAATGVVDSAAQAVQGLVAGGGSTASSAASAVGGTLGG
jgi:hypothetical protein